MFEVNYTVTGGLENLLRRLKIGQRLRARVVDTVDPNGYLLRIQGYNIMTQSDGNFTKFAEIDVVVQEIEPHLILNLIADKKTTNRDKSQLDITV